MNKDMSGIRLGQYELRDRLGRGGMAEVYRAYQPGMDRFVAVKLLLGHLADDDKFIERFRREAQAVGRLRHAHIVNVFDFGIQDDIYFMVMEYLRGGNLKQRITTEGQMPLYDALRIAGQLADALAYAHTAGMIHRDLKPANVMFSTDDTSDAILTDFGIARILTESNLTNSGMMVGTPAYMSPEAGHGLPADERADIYALGIILYEMITGEVPYSADTPLAIVMKHINAPLPSLTPYQLPEPVELLIMRAMAKKPEERFATADDMKADIDEILPLIKDYQRPATPPPPQPASEIDGDALTQIPPVDAVVASEPDPDQPTAPPTPAAPVADIAPDATNAIPAPTQPPTRENSPTPAGIPAPKAASGEGADAGKPLPSGFPFPGYMLAGALVAVVIVLGIGLLVIGGDDGNDTGSDPNPLSVEERQGTATSFVGTADAQMQDPQKNATVDAMSTKGDPALTSIALTLDAQQAAIANVTITVDQQATRIAELETAQAATPTPTTDAQPTATATATATITTDTPAPTAVAAADNNASPANSFVFAEFDPDAPLDMPAEIPLLTGAFEALDRMDREWTRGDGELALQRLNVALADDPDDVDARIVRAIFFAMGFNTDAALEDAEAAVELAPDNGWAHLALADAHYINGNHEAMQVATAAAFELAPNDPAVLWRMGRTAAQFGDEENAERFYRAAIAAGGQGFRFGAAAGAFFEDYAEYALAIPLLETGVQGFFFDDWLFYQLARAYIIEDNATRAYELARVRGAERDLAPATLANYAYIAYAAGDYEQAEAWALRAEEFQEEDLAATAYVIALIYTAQGSPEADQRWDAVRELGQTQVSPFMNLRLEHDARLDYARFLIEQERYEDALAPLNAMLGNDLSWYVPAYVLRGEVLLALERPQDAYNSYLEGFGLLYDGNDPDQRAMQDELRQRLVNLALEEDAVEVVVPQTDFAFDPDDSGFSLFSGLSDIHDDVDDLAVLDRDITAARAYLTTILDESPDDSEALSAYAMLLIEHAGNPDAALERIERLEEIDPENLVTYIARWHHSTHWNVNDTETALQTLSAALEQYPDHPALLWRMALSLTEIGEVEAGSTFAERAFANPADGFRYAYWAGNVALSTGDDELARDALIIAHLARPWESFTLELLLAALLNLEDHDTLREWVPTLQGTANTTPHLYSHLAFAALRADAPELALQMAQSSVALNDASPESMYMLGLVYGDGFADYARAVSWLSDAAEGDKGFFINLDNGYTHPFDMARFFAATERYEEALSWVQAGLDEHEWFLPYYVLGGEAYAALDDPAAARDLYRRGLEFAEDGSAAQRDLLARIDALDATLEDDAAAAAE